MKINKIKFFAISLAVLSASNICFDKTFAAAPAVNSKPAVQQQNAQGVVGCVVSPVEVVNHPAKYLNKTISFNAEFVSYTALGLDYKPAYREAAKYIGILIKRDDVKDHVIPLSEMKIFIKRETAEKHSDLEAGDKIRITGTVFSNALGDPWVDVKSFTIVEKKNKDKKTAA